MDKRFERLYKAAAMKERQTRKGSAANRRANNLMCALGFKVAREMLDEKTLRREERWLGLL